MKHLNLLRTAALLAVATACAGGAKEAASDSATANSDSLAKSPTVHTDTIVAWKFTPPDSWKERTTAVLVSTEDRTKYFQGARSAQHFDYLPHDTTIVPQSLLLVTVYDSTEWAAIEKEEGPPVGEVITREGGMVYVASLPQSNPFVEKTVDYAEYEKRTITLEQVKKGFQVVSR